MAFDPGARKQLEAWLESFAECVRRVDAESARPLFAASLRAFGTRVFCAEGQEAVEQQQWRYIWPRTRDFAFETESLEGWLSADASQASLAVPWRSTGFDAEGRAFERRGRATIVLVRAGADWQAHHTHFSVDPAAQHPVLGRPRP
jgi:ketosteroid isomerase-like protein